MIGFTCFCIMITLGAASVLTPVAEPKSQPLKETNPSSPVRKRSRELPNEDRQALEWVHFLLAAGEHDCAQAYLNVISGRNQIHISVLQARLRIAARQNDWEQGRESRIINYKPRWHCAEGTT